MSSAETQEARAELASPALTRRLRLIPVPVREPTPAPELAPTPGPTPAPELAPTPAQAPTPGPTQGPAPAPTPGPTPGPELTPGPEPTAGPEPTPAQARMFPGIRARPWGLGLPSRLRRR